MKEDGFLMKKQIKIKYIEPELCPKCLEKFIPTKQSMKECLFCKRGKKYVANSRDYRSRYSQTQ